ncbi:hypothetical protein [Flavobacterium hungaricum]|uniref:Uncharacterized protein n=1 Tax=Flavobacterium hungaricum TaxID=2082725 RepID=A0ABR9TI17_9FLAO|nr:hypothetical protein [Flavobacterium hungaricum]MBE8724994.1 hypothetical protein [Flavobacterium hungaricum]
MYELEKEKYLGNTKNIFNNKQGIAVVETEYQSKVFEGWHSHANAHIAKDRIKSLNRIGQNSKNKNPDSLNCRGLDKKLNCII